MDYTLRELMAIIAAREISNGDIVFCGTGISMVAAMAAKHMNAPESIIFFETGAIDSALEEIPMAVADPRVMYSAAFNGGFSMPSPRCRTGLPARGSSGSWAPPRSTSSAT